MTRGSKVKNARRQLPPPPSGTRLPRGLLLLAALGIAGLIAAGALLWGSSNGGETLSGIPTADPGPVHVHGLGINPADSALFIATHSGLYRVDKNSRKAKRVGNRLQDTMGFTIVGPNRFLGSGHPDLTEMREKGLPPLLGLIESGDAGESWESVSLGGEADFHVLRFAGERVYGYDATNDRLLASADEGKTWNELERPGPLVDLAVDPGDPRHIVVAAASDLAQGLYESRNTGSSWNRIGDTVGLLAWPTTDQLYIVDDRGQTFVSADAGRQLEPRGDIGGQPAALLAQNPGELYVALHDGTIKKSADGGVNWVVRSTP